MKHTLIVLMVLGLVYSSLMQASCTLGSLTSVNTVGSATTPYFIAYSPIVEGNVFAAAACFVAGNPISVYSVNTSTGAFTAVSGSPFAGPTGPVGIDFSPVIYGNLFAVTGNNNVSSISIWRVDPTTGAFTQAAGSPYSTGSFPWAAAFSPLINGNIFVGTVINGSNTVNVYSMDPVTGSLTAVSGSPFTTGAAGAHPRGFAFSPNVNGNLFAVVSNKDTSNFAMFSVNTTTGVFTAVSGSPFAIGTSPTGAAFSPLVNGNLFVAIANQGSNTVSVYSVNTSTGVPTAVSGSPFAAGTSPSAIAFSPLINGNLYAATANNGSNNITVYSVNTSTGVFTQVSGSPFSTGASTGPFGAAFSPILSGGVFFATTKQTTNQASSFKVSTFIPTLTTLSQYILSGSSIALNGTIGGGTAPYTVTWQDSTVQSGINTSSFSRTVSPTDSTIYSVSTITDANSCSAGPSNTVTIGVRTCP